MAWLCLVINWRFIPKNQTIQTRSAVYLMRWHNRVHYPLVPIGSCWIEFIVGTCISSAMAGTDWINLQLCFFTASYWIEFVVWKRLSCDVPIGGKLAQRVNFQLCFPPPIQLCTLHVIFEYNLLAWKCHVMPKITIFNWYSQSIQMLGIPASSSFWESDYFNLFRKKSNWHHLFFKQWSHLFLIDWVSQASIYFVIVFSD